MEKHQEISPGMRVEVAPWHRNVFGDNCYDDDRSRHVRRGRVLRWVPEHGGCWAVEPEGRPGCTYFYRSIELKPLSVLDELAGLA